MKHLILILSILLIPSLTFAQSAKADRGIGLAIRSSVNSELPSARVVPCIQYLAGNHQLELGLGLTPVLREDQQVMSGEFSYQYFPNGTTNKFNGYLITSLSYVRRGVDTFFPTDYHYLFLDGGYGFLLHAGNGIYLGTHVTGGIFTYQKRTENPSIEFLQVNLLESFEAHVTAHISLSYRF